MGRGPDLYQALDLTDLVLVGSLVGVIPVDILFLCLRRFWRGRLTSGAAKG